MAKSVGRVCAQIAILLTIYGSIQCVKSISPDAYNSFGSRLTNIQPDEIVRLSAEQLVRQRRAAPADSTSVVDAKNQYQSVNTNANNGSMDATVTTVDNNKDSKLASSSNTGSISYNVHNVGVNGTGQRKDMTNANATTTINVAAPPKKTQLLASQPSQQYPKKVASQPVQQQVSTSSTTSTTERPLIDDVDVAEEVITKEAANLSLTRREDHFDYYSSLLYVSKDETASLWSQMRKIPENNMLSSSHRRAMTVELNFDFPFYGHNVRNITVATGGFLYTGEYVHSWLAATQYIAPLMANFDTSMSDDSFVRLQDNGTAYTVVWENVTLQDKPDFGKFTFSTTLHKNGDIVFVYYQLPTLINNIQDNQHPVKVGLSDAYIVDKMLYFARRKTIYEYHRVTFGQQEITNATIIKLTALPTCLSYTDCQSCINHNTTFECAWCPTLNRCSTSTGNDRKKQDWQQKGCERSLITTIEQCPALGQKGNNAAQENSNNNNDNNSSSRGNNTNNNTANNPNNTNNNTANTTSPAKKSAAVSEPTINSTHSSITGAAANDNSKSERSEHLAVLSPENKTVGVAFGFLVPICLVFAVTLWLFYAYRNPHTRSGQLLIQFRPSQWSWRRGEARYTAATIHM